MRENSIKERHSDIERGEIERDGREEDSEKERNTEREKEKNRWSF